GLPAESRMALRWRRIAELRCWESLMDALDLPADMIAFLRDQQVPQLCTRCFGALRLISLEQLRVEALHVTPTHAAFAREDPHGGAGSYAVPAVNLVRAKGQRPTDFPSWLLLWLPNERRYGSYDLDHGDLMMYM